MIFKTIITYLIILIANTSYAQLNTFLSGEKIEASKINENFNNMKRKYYVYNHPEVIDGSDNGVGYSHNLTTIQLKPNKTYTLVFEYNVLLVHEDGFAIRVCEGLATPSSSEDSNLNPSCQSTTPLPVVAEVGGNASTVASGKTFGINNISGPKIIKTPNAESNIDYTVQIVSLSNGSKLRKLIMTITEENNLIQVNSLTD